MSWEVLRAIATLCAQEQIVLRVIPEGLLLTGTRFTKGTKQISQSVIITFQMLEDYSGDQASFGASDLVRLHVRDIRETLDKKVRDDRSG